MNCDGDDVSKRLTNGCPYHTAFVRESAIADCSLRSNSVWKKVREKASPTDQARIAYCDLD